MLELILFYALLSSALYYLGSRAMITQWLWSRYPQRFARFMDCAACTGFWYGLTLALALGWWDPRYRLFDLPLVAAPLVGLCSLVWTPLVASLMQAGLDRLGSAVPDAEPETPIAEREAVVLPTVMRENQGAVLQFSRFLAGEIDSETAYCRSYCKNGKHDAKCKHKSIPCTCLVAAPPPPDPVQAA